MRMLISINARLLHYKFSLSPYFILCKLVIKYNAHSAEGKLVIPPGGDTSPPPGRRKLFVSPTHIFIHLPIYFYQDWSDTYFCYNNILSLFILLLLMFHLWPLGALSGWLWCPFGMPHVIVFFLFFFSNSLFSVIPRSSRLILYFLSQTKNETFPPRSHKASFKCG